MKSVKYLIQYSIPTPSLNGETVYTHNFTEKKIVCEDKMLESAIEIAKSEAYNGEYTVEDDGEPEPEPEVTTDDVLNALLGVSK